MLSGLRLLIVTPEIHGPYRNGGIGTAFSTLAMRCAQAGATVSVAYIPLDGKDDAPLDPWIEFYRKRSVALLPLTDEAEGAFPALEAPPAAAGLGASIIGCGSARGTSTWPFFRNGWGWRTTYCSPRVKD